MSDTGTERMTSIRLAQLKTVKWTFSDQTELIAEIERAQMSETDQADWIDWLENGIAEWRLVVAEKDETIRELVKVLARFASSREGVEASTWGGEDLLDDADEVLAKVRRTP